MSPCVERLSSSSSTACSVSAMLSPVSPSATGKTLRSLTSSRRASSSASERWTTLRKRTRLGSAKVAARLRLGDLARLEAAGADVDALRRARLGDADLLQVRVEASLGRDHGVRAALAEGRALSAGVTDTGHCGREA